MFIRVLAHLNLAKTLENIKKSKETPKEGHYERKNTRSKILRLRVKIIDYGFLPTSSLSY